MSAIHWTTVLVVTIHAVLWLVCVVELMGVPRIMPVFERIGIPLPPMTVFLVNFYSASQSYWYLMWMSATGLIVLDGIIFYRLFRDPKRRRLGVMWFFVVLLVLMGCSILITISLNLPLLEFFRMINFPRTSP